MHHLGCERSLMSAVLHSELDSVAPLKHRINVFRVAFKETVDDANINIELMVAIRLYSV